MNQRDMERLEKDALYTMQVTNDLKDRVISSYLNELSKAIKANVKKCDLIILVFSKS